MRGAPTRLLVPVLLSSMHSNRRRRSRIVDDTRELKGEDYDRTEAAGPGATNSQRSGLSEDDSIGPQADVLSPTGTRMDTDVPPEQADAMRKGPPA